MAYPKDNLRRILFLDIETAAVVPDYSQLDDRLKESWSKRATRIHRHASGLTDDLTDDDVSEYFQDKAAIYAEYAKVVCVSMGVIKGEGDTAMLRITSFADPDERDILKKLSDLMAAHFYDPHSSYLCGHNVREFDIPFLCRRYLINNMTLPTLLKVGGLKPWQVPYILDTLDLWKFGDYKYYSSLDLLCTVLDIPSPKSDMNGSQVTKAFWEGRLDDIRHYCERDVVATVRLYLRCAELPGLADDQIEFI